MSNVSGTPNRSMPATRVASFYRPRTPDDGWLDLVKCDVLEVDEFGQFAVAIRDEDGRIWGAHGDMESHSLLFNPALLYEPADAIAEIAP